MENKRNDHRYHQPSLVWPVILITAGVLFLLSNLGMLDIDLWSLWRLWPLLLILGGLELILGRRSVLGNLVVLVLTLIIIAGVVFVLVAAPDLLGTQSVLGDLRIEEPLDGINEAILRIDFAAGKLMINDLVDSRSLIEGNLELATEREPERREHRNDDQVVMSLTYGIGNFSSWGKGDEWDLALSPKVPLSIEAEIGAGDAEMDLSSLKIESLSVEAGAGRTLVQLPSEGEYDAVITGGVGQLIVEVPEEVAVRLHLEKGISSVNLPSRFVRESESTFETSDFGENDNSIDLEINVGVGAISVKDS